MGESGNDLLDFMFKICVIVLVDIAQFLGITYEALNIILFVIIQPALIILFVVLWQIERRKNIVARIKSQWTRQISVSLTLYMSTLEHANLNLRNRSGGFS